MNLYMDVRDQVVEVALAHCQEAFPAQREREAPPHVTRVTEVRSAFLQLFAPSCTKGWLVEVERIASDRLFEGQGWLELVGYTPQCGYSQVPSRVPPSSPDAYTSTARAILTIARALPDRELGRVLVRLLLPAAGDRVSFLESLEDLASLLEHTHPWVRYLLGKAYLAEGRILEAQRCFEQAWQMAHPSADASLLNAIDQLAWFPLLSQEQQWVAGVPFPMLEYVFFPQEYGQRLRCFTGREETLRELDGTLSTGALAGIEKSQAVLLHGPAGVGKTALAIAYLQRHYHDYRALFWVRADSRSALLADFLALAWILELPEYHESERLRSAVAADRWLRERIPYLPSLELPSLIGEHEQHALVSAVNRWLGSHPRWLLVFDGVGADHVLQEFLPTAAGGHILLTSSYGLAAECAGKTVEVPPLAAEEGALFLLRRGGMVREDAGIEEVPGEVLPAAFDLARQLGGSPLALEQAGTYMREGRRDLEQYLGLYRSAARPALLQWRGAEPALHARSLYATWSSMLKRLQRDDPVAFDVLRLCSSLFPDAIPEDLLTVGGSGLGRALGKVANHPEVFQRALKRLLDTSFLDRESASGALRCSRLVQAMVLDTMSRHTRRTFATRAVRVVARGWQRARASQQAQLQLVQQVQACRGLISSWGLTCPEAVTLAALGREPSTN